MLIIQQSSHLRLHDSEQVLPVELEVRERMSAVKDGRLQLAPSTSSITQLYNIKEEKDVFCWRP